MAQLKSNARKRRLRPGTAYVRMLHGKARRTQVGRLEEVTLHYTEGSPNNGFVRGEGGRLYPVIVVEDVAGERSTAVVPSTEERMED